MRRSAMTALVIVLSAALILPLTAIVQAGEFHHGEELACGQCHVMHGTFGSNSYNGGAGYTHLLKGATINDTCLACHNGGATSSIPDVVADGLSTDILPTDTGLNNAYSSDPYKNSGGFFLGNWNAATSKFGHDLWASAPVTPVQGTWVSPNNGMTCGDCHEVHGSNNWRNIKTKPGTAGSTIDVTASTSGATDDVLMEGDLETEGSPTHYQTDRVRFNENNDVANWCKGCHTSITTGSKHAQNRSFADSSATNVDYANWRDGANGFGAAVDDGNGTGTFGIPRLRFAQSGASWADCGTVANTNQVFCLTCHKAHGTKYDSALVWPNSRIGSGATAYAAIDRGAACQQCHNRGV